MFKQLTALAFSIFLLIFLLHTSVQAESPSATCTYAETATCIDYIGSHWRAFPDQARESCVSEEGTFSPNGSCTRQNRTGRCQLSGGNEMEFHIALYAPITLEQAKATCASLDGVFLRD
jgi:hypothetical protein